MIIIYESKTGFTERYARMLAEKTGMKLYRVNELSAAEKNEEVVFLSWLKAGRIQSLKKVRNLNLRAICVTGTGSAEENNEETIISGNKLGQVPFFYAQGGCLPLKDLKGMDRLMMAMFAKMLKKRKDDKFNEAVDHIENGFDGVKEENLIPLLQWLNSVK